MSRLEISLLGTFRVQFDGTDISDVLRTRKERALLAYLAEEPPRLQPREKVAEFFWPNRPETYARMNLRQALLGLRKAFGGEEQTNSFLEVSDDVVEFSHKHVWMDTTTFNAYIQITKSHPHLELHNCQECINQLEEAVELYRGDFLSDLILNEVTAFQEWAVFNRERYIRSMINALQSLSKAYFHRSNFDQAHKYAWRYVEMAPLEESAHRLLMRLLTKSGRRNAALQQYQLCKSIIARELGIDPSPETQQLYSMILNNQPIERIDTGSLAGKLPRTPRGTRPLKPPTGPLYDPNTEMPLRAIFLDRLRHAIMRMKRNQSNALLISLSVSFPYHEHFLPDLKKQIDVMVARRLTGSVREDDTVAKVIENEYALILEDIQDLEGVPGIITKINKVFSTPLQVQDQKIQIRLAIGWSIYPQDGRDPGTLINKADIAMRTNRLQQNIHHNQK
ncbi:MAG: BTAD domain-containing putative transcriptional regulator [Anaerolineaceae bacterium]|jgi:DNA-binding SARP family transcriptional activator/GGDEF domain-containing protein|nr:BTAD domain-containing putative transcriptional regulator [Anaerolineaceae bacterium]